MKASKKRFAPDSEKDLYVAELNARMKRREEDWAFFGDSLRVLSDRAYPDLEDKARERLALYQFLSQIGGRRPVTCWNCGGKGHIARAP